MRNGKTGIKLSDSKVCGKCKVAKSKDDFTMKANGVLMAWCKECKKAEKKG